MGRWHTEKYTVEDLNNDIVNKIISIPKYQRGAVWNKKQKEKLIDSMNKGFPFGSILLYKKEDNKYQIIDGLQRSTTIIEFVDNPAKFFNEENIDMTLLNDIIKHVSANPHKSELESQLKDLISKWITENHHNMQDIQRMQYSELTDLIVENYPNCNNHRNEINQTIKNMFTKFQDICNNIATMEIPALIYEGDENLLPEIFERINSQGAKLTKQQIYAAAWAQDFVTIDSPDLFEILTANRDRYDNMLDENMELDEYNPTEFIRKKELNIFELVFGFGKMISKKYPHLFGYDDDVTKVNSIGFNLINACLLQRSANLNNLNISLKKEIGLDTYSVESFLKEIISAIEFVDRRLAKVLKFKSNSRTLEKSSTLHTEMQIVSIIASVFIARHVTYSIDEKNAITDITVTTQKDNYNCAWHNMKNKFEKNILRIYTLDIINQKWKGSGDSKLDNIIFENYYYNREISWDEFRQMLDGYYSTINSERNERKQVTSPKEAEKLLLNIIYAPIFTAEDQIDSNKFDIEHIAPKNLMKNRICSYSEDFRLPISSFANLCLLPEYDNRTKKDKTIYQDEGYTSKVNIEYVENKFTFTKKEDLSWLEENLDEEQFRKAYMRVLDDRFKKMKDLIKENLF